jgi:two-component system sensor histidine kinase UhpB
MKVDSNISEKADTLLPAVAEVLWRAAHEGLANAEKHARAEAVQIELELEAATAAANGTANVPGGCRAILRLSDDGLGLPEGAESFMGHYGLRGLRERVEGVGGTFRVSKASPKGTTMEVRIPVVST